MQQYSEVLKTIANLKILVVGDLMVDQYLMGDVKRISPEAPVPVVNITSRNRKLGGAGNVIRNLRAVGAAVRTVGYIGEDAEGDWLIEALNNDDIDTRFLFRQKQARTIVKTRVASNNQQLVRYDEEDVSDVPKEFITFLVNNLSDILENVHAIIISDYGKGLVTDEVMTLIRQAALQKNIPISVDPKGTRYEKYSGATVSTPNLKELSEAVGFSPKTEEQILEAGLKLCKTYNLKYVLATRSEKGMSLINAKLGTKQDFPAIVHEVMDVTGAGDTVIAVFTACMATGADMETCCRLANCAASVVVSKFGAAVASPDEILTADGRLESKYRKCMSISNAEKWVQDIKAQGKRVIFTNGCFDIVHAGHIASFKKARAMGDVLVVGLNTDNSIKQIKGLLRPIIDEENRAALLESIEYIDCVVLFDDDTPIKLIEAFSPDVLVKGKDWEGKRVVGEDWVKNHGGQVCFIDLEEGLSTTNIINKILDAYKTV